MNWESEPSYQVMDKAYPLPLGGIGKALRLLSAIIGGESGSNRDHIGRGRNPLVWSVTSSLCRMEHLSQYPGLGLEGRAEELRRLAMVEWTFVGCALMNTRGGEKVWIGSKSSSP